MAAVRLAPGADGRRIGPTPPCPHFLGTPLKRFTGDDTWDAIVVGSGIDGLTTAVLLGTKLGVVYRDADGKIVMRSVAHHTICQDGTPFPGLEHPAMVAPRMRQDVQRVTLGVFNPREWAPPQSAASAAR